MPTPPKTLTELLAALSDVSEESDGWLAACPGHADSKPSLRVSVGQSGKVLLKCRAGCTTEHVLDSLNMEMTDLTHMEAGDAQPISPARSTSAQATPGAIAGLAMRLDGYEQARGQYSEDEHPADPAYRYAQERFGLSDTDIGRLGLGYTDDLGGNVPRLVVPFRTPQGVARNFQARALDPAAKVRWQGPKSPEGGSWSPLGWFPGESGWSEVLIAEGPGDALTAAAVGYDTIGVAGAARVNNPAIVAEIAQWTTGRPVVIAGDGDAAGRQFSATLAKGLIELGAHVRVLNLPDGVDLNDWRLADPAAFQTNLIRAIESAETTTTSATVRARWDDRKYEMTDLGNAQYLRDWVAGQGSGVKYSAETGFYILQDGVWRRDISEQIRKAAQSVAKDLADLAKDARIEASKEGADAKIIGFAKAMTAHSRYTQSTRGIDSMIRELRPMVAVALNEFDKHHHLLAVKNGVVDLRTGELLPHDASYLITRQVEFNYRPDAVAPRWLSFLTEVFPGQPGMPEYMQRLTGYAVSGETDEQCFAIFYGRGSNGKSVYTDTLTRIFADITTTTPFSTFEQKPNGGIPNDIAALNGARMVVASEGEAGRFMNESLIKRATGKDPLTARFLNREFFTFYPEFLLTLLTNAKPTFRGADEGLWRRVKLIAWERHFAPSERDPRLPAKLLAEAEGILAWAVHGAVEWYANGLQDPARIVDATSEYRATSDIMEGFLPGVYIKDENGKVEATSVFKAFQEWADSENHLDLKKWSSRAFYGAMEERQVIRKRSTGGKFVLQGIRRAPRTADNPEWAAQQEPTPERVLGGGGPMEGADLDNL
jgi:putative DNA primase/helicase